MTFVVFLKEFSCGKNRSKNIPGGAQQFQRNYIEAVKFLSMCYSGLSFWFICPKMYFVLFKNDFDFTDIKLRRK